MAQKAAVIGSGPNGLAAAVTLARAGVEVDVYEGAASAGGGARTRSSINDRQVLFDSCSAVHPMALASPFFREFGLAERVEFVTPDASFAQGMTDRRSPIVYRDLARTVEGLGPDGKRWNRVFRTLLSGEGSVSQFSNGSVMAWPDKPFETVKIGMPILLQALRTVGSNSSMDALLAGAEAHAGTSIPSMPSAAIGMVLTMHAQHRGWPLPIGGSQAIVDALIADLNAHGGRVHTGVAITSLHEVEPADIIVANVTPAGLLELDDGRLPQSYRRKLGRFRFGAGTVKADFVLSEPIPWRDSRLNDVGTVHLGGSRADVATAEKAAMRGQLPAAPFSLIAEPKRWDPSRAPEGKHVVYSYAHVPAGYDGDPVALLSAQLERYAPGFRDLVIDAEGTDAAQMEAHNPNYVGGDISSGALTMAQFIARPSLSPSPWRTPVEGLYLASASTAPGPGVHGMAGYNAARLALARASITLPSLSP